MAVGVLIDIDEQAIENTRRIRGVEGEVLYDDHDRAFRIPKHTIVSKSQPPNFAGAA